MPMRLRIRLPELLEEHNVNAYALVKASGGRLSLPTMYRLKRKRGRVRQIDAELVETLCEMLAVGLTDVLELEGERPSTRLRARSSARPHRSHRGG